KAWIFFRMRVSMCVLLSEVEEDSESIGNAFRAAGCPAGGTRAESKSYCAGACSKQRLENTCGSNGAGVLLAILVYGVPLRTRRSDSGGQAGDSESCRIARSGFNRKPQASKTPDSVPRGGDCCSC